MRNPIVTPKSLRRIEGGIILIVQFAILYLFAHFGPPMGPDDNAHYFRNMGLLLLGFLPWFAADLGASLVLIRVFRHLRPRLLRRS